MPEETYFAQSDWLSQSSLKTFAEAPALYRHGVRDSTRPQQLGKAGHCALLEPEQFEARYCPTALVRAGTAAWALEAAAAHPRELLKADDWNAALAMGFSALLQPGPLGELMVWPGLTRELSFFWVDPDTGLRCKGRADMAALDYGLAADIKTVHHVHAFGRSVRTYHYHWQQAHYSNGLAALGYPMREFWFFAIESERYPYLYKTYTLPQRWVDRAQSDLRRALQDFKEAAAVNRWPGFSTEPEELYLPDSWLED